MVTATIVDGTTLTGMVAGTNFTKDFSITIDALPYFFPVISNSTAGN